MKYLILLSLLFTPVSASEHPMSCESVKEVIEVIMDDPYLSDKQKTKLLTKLVGKHGLRCLKDAHD